MTKERKRELINEQKAVMFEALDNTYDWIFDREGCINWLIDLEVGGFTHESKRFKEYFKKRFNEEL